MIHILLLSLLQPADGYVGVKQFPGSPCFQSIGIGINIFIHLLEATAFFTHLSENLFLAFILLFFFLHKTQNFFNMEFALKYGIRQLLTHEKIPETHVLAALLAGNA